jgi:hypothetical protein
MFSKIFAGEDLPEADALTNEQKYELNELGSKIKDEDLRNGVYKAINDGTINSSNFGMCKEKCDMIIKEEKEKEKTNGK